MITSEIIRTQLRVGAAGDSFWGPKSIAACQAHLRKLMPLCSPWPKSDQASLQSFYGSPGDESNLVRITFPYRMYYEGRVVETTLCHARVADSLVRVLTDIKNRYGGDSKIMEAAQDYGGVYNNRNKRGGNTPSVHAYGAAIDLDADDNGNRVSWPVVADMPIEVMECFAREGWVSAGAWWHRDGMHHEATSL